MSTMTDIPESENKVDRHRKPLAKKRNSYAWCSSVHIELLRRPVPLKNSIAPGVLGGRVNASPSTLAFNSQAFSEDSKQVLKTRDFCGGILRSWGISC